MRHILFTIILSVLFAIGFSNSTNAQDDCSSKELKAFDFLLGDWKQDGSSGRMEITKILDGCGIHEVWLLKEFNAVLLRNFNNATKKWYLTFTAHDLIPQVWEGRSENGNWYFYREWELNGRKRLSRTYWNQTSDRSFEKIVEMV